MELREKVVNDDFQLFGMSQGGGTLRNEKNEGAISGERTSGHDELTCL